MPVESLEDCLIVLYIKSHNNISFSGRDSCLVLYFVCSLLGVLHREKSVLPKCTKCEQKPDQSSAMWAGNTWNYSVLIGTFAG